MSAAERRPVLGAIAVLIHDQHMLLVQRGKPPNQGMWGCPGGHVEWGETAMAAAVRELHEETGITATARAYIASVDVVPSETVGAERHFFLAAVLCDYVSGEPVAADDAQDARWIPLDDIRNGQLVMTPRVPEVMELALEHLRKS